MPSEEQRLANLREANRIRGLRSELKRDLATGKVKLSTVLRADDPDLATMKVKSLLGAVTGLGPKKVTRALNACRIRPTQPLSLLSPRRREQLLSRIAADHPSMKGRL